MKKVYILFGYDYRVINIFSSMELAQQKLEIINQHSLKYFKELWNTATSKKDKNDYYNNSFEEYYKSKANTDEYSISEHDVLDSVE